MVRNTRSVLNHLVEFLFDQLLLIVLMILLFIFRNNGSHCCPWCALTDLCIHLNLNSSVLLVLMFFNLIILICLILLNSNSGGLHHWIRCIHLPFFIKFSTLMPFKRPVTVHTYRIPIQQCMWICCLRHHFKNDLWINTVFPRYLRLPQKVLKLVF